MHAARAVSTVVPPLPDGDGGVTDRATRGAGSVSSLACLFSFFLSFRVEGALGSLTPRLLNTQARSSLGSSKPDSDARTTTSRRTWRARQTYGNRVQCSCCSPCVAVPRRALGRAPTAPTQTPCPARPGTEARRASQRLARGAISRHDRADAVASRRIEVKVPLCVFSARAVECTELKCLAVRGMFSVL